MALKIRTKKNIIIEGRPPSIIFQQCIPAECEFVIREDDPLAKITEYVEVIEEVPLGSNNIFLPLKTEESLFYLDVISTPGNFIAPLETKLFLEDVVECPINQYPCYNAINRAVEWPSPPTNYNKTNLKNTLKLAAMKSCFHAPGKIGVWAGVTKQDKFDFEKLNEIFAELSLLGETTLFSPMRYVLDSKDEKYYNLSGRLRSFPDWISAIDNLEVIIGAPGVFTYTAYLLNKPVVFLGSGGFLQEPFLSGKCFDDCQNCGNALCSKLGVEVSELAEVVETLLKS